MKIADSVEMSWLSGLESFQVNKDSVAYKGIRLSIYKNKSLMLLTSMDEARLLLSPVKAKGKFSTFR